MTYCHKCKHNGQHDEACLSCECQEQYSYKYSKYLIDGYDPQQPSTDGSQQVTNFSDGVEDQLRKALYTLLDLQPNELLLVKAIHDGKTLTEFASDMEKLSKKNETFSRFRAFQTRKSIVKKLPKFGQALLTVGQRRALKKD